MRPALVPASARAGELQERGPWHVDLSGLRDYGATKSPTLTNSPFLTSTRITS